MSTRATIKIQKKERKDIWVYHHCDGYPSGVGTELKEFLAGKKDVEWNPAEIAAELCQMDYQYELTSCQHGDEEYAYLIDCDNKILTCYKVGWDEFDWKNEKIVEIP